MWTVKKKANRNACIIEEHQSITTKIIALFFILPLILFPINLQPFSSSYVRLSFAIHQKVITHTLNNSFLTVDLVWEHVRLSNNCRWNNNEIEFRLAIDFFVCFNFFVVSVKSLNALIDFKRANLSRKAALTFLCSHYSSICLFKESH